MRAAFLLSQWDRKNQVLIRLFHSKNLCKSVHLWQIKNTNAYKQLPITGTNQTTNWNCI